MQSLQAQSPTDWTQWRGASRDGIIASFTPPQTWPDALIRRWNVEIGTGYATPIVVADRVYQFSRIGENETMTAFDAATGETVWQGGYPALFTLANVAAAHGKGPKSTPVFFNNRLYSIGMTGTVTAWDATSGERCCGRSLATRQTCRRRPRMRSHRSSRVAKSSSISVATITGPSLPSISLTAAEKWKWTGDGPGYGSPVITEVAGTRQLVTVTQGKVVGLDASTGALLLGATLLSPRPRSMR